MRDALGAVQSVLVLGGGSEIALTTVRKLVGDRCRTVVLAARRPDELAGTVSELRAAGATDVDTVAFDALDPASHEKIIDGIFEAHGDIDVVLLAFGVLGDQKEFDADPAAAAQAIAANFGGAVSAGLAVAHNLRKQGHGTLVVLSSVAGERVARTTSCTAPPRRASTASRRASATRWWAAAPGSWWCGRGSCTPR